MDIPISRKITDSETKRDIKMHWPLYDDHHSASDQSLTQNYQEYANYKKNAFLYLTDDYENWTKRTKLIIYDTKRKRQEIISINTPNSLSWATCITQLPNGELFCYGTYPLCLGLH